MYKHQISDCQSACLWNLVATTNLSAYAIKRKYPIKGAVSQDFLAFYNFIIWTHLGPW